MATKSSPPDGSFPLGVVIGRSIPKEGRPRLESRSDVLSSRALAALAASALFTVDAVVAYAQEAGCGELTGYSSDDALAKLALSPAGS
jgi:hypothetical protein